MTHSQCDHSSSAVICVQSTTKVDKVTVKFSVLFSSVLQSHRYKATRASSYEKMTYVKEVIMQLDPVRRECRTMVFRGRRYIGA